MNQVYLTSPISAPLPGDSPPDVGSLDILKEVIISTYPGYHLPHVWLARSGQEPRISTLDLCKHGTFTILTGVGGQCWRDAVSQIQQSMPGLSISVYSIGFRCNYMDIYRDWRRVRGVQEDGAVLIRPDQFCCWRYPFAAVDATELLRKALECALCNGWNA